MKTWLFRVPTNQCLQLNYMLADVTDEEISLKSTHLSYLSWL